MRTRILALIIVAVMIFPTSFAAFAASGVEVNKVMFTDADKATELLSLHDYAEGVSCNFSYSASGSANVYGMLILRRNGKIVSTLEQEFSLAASGIASFDEVLYPDISEAGVYEVVFLLFDSRENMHLVKGSNARITGEVYPAEYDVTNGFGTEFDDEASKSKMSYYRANGSDATKDIIISTDYAKHGASSLGIPVAKSYDRLFPKSTYAKGVLRNKLVELGDGRYRVSGYIYPVSEAVTFSPRINLNNGKEVNLISKVTVQPGKWTYFCEDYDVNGYFNSSLVHGRPQIQIDAALKAEQYIYIDDLKLIKLEEGLEEMTTVVNAVVKAKVGANETVAVTAESADKIYAIEAVTADENGVVEAYLSLSDGFETEDITINVYSEEGYSQNLAAGLVVDDMTYVDFRYFTLPEIDGVKINSVVVDEYLVPYDEITLSEGDVSVAFDIINTQEKKLRVVAAKYNNGMFVSSAISEEGDNAVLIEDVNAEDTVELFLVDDTMTLASHIYTLTSDGMTETEVCTNAAEFEELPVATYNTVSSCIEFVANVTEDCFVIVASYPQNKAEDEDYAYFGVQKLSKGENNISLLINDDRYEESSVFNLDYYTTSADVSGSFEPFDYIGEKELMGYYETINNPEATIEDIYTAISSKALNIDMTHYKALSGKEKLQNRALELFIEYNDQKDIASAEDIQNIFNEALATVILSCSATTEAIENLGEQIPLNEEYLADFIAEEDGFKSKVTSLVNANAASAEDAGKEKANEIFEEAYLIAQLTYNTETYGAFMKMVTETYKENINLDLSEIGSLNESDVFKYMYKNRSDITNMESVGTLYEKAIKNLKEDKKSKPSRGSGGGGGGGGTYVPVKKEEPAPAPVRTKFTDMDDNHWALESVVFLNGIGVVSDATDFRPDASITREEAVKMLICSFGELDTSAECAFADVDKTSWCYPYIASAYKTGMVNGINETAFGIGNNLSRQDALVMIYRILKDKFDKVSEDFVFEFSDESTISDYAVEAAKVLCANGIVNGYSDGTFRPIVPISRAEFAKLLTTVFRR